MKNYRYFENVEKNAYFTDIPCQFCGSKQSCLEGIFFEKNGILSVCLNCFDSKKAGVEIPDYIKSRVKTNADSKFELLQFNPPVPWIQSNDWPVCCDDYMVYIGEWEQSDFNGYSETGNGKECLKKLIDSETFAKVENFDILWEDIGNETAAFAFKCPHCGKIIIICQDY